MAYYFKWNGTSCLQKGLRLRTAPEIIRPEERVEHVIIPGRAGELTHTEGSDIYNSYIQTVTVTAEDRQRLAEAEKWLRGDGYVTFSNQPTLRQRARVINSVTFTKLSHNMDRWAADIQFYCEPLKEPLSDDTDVIMLSGSTITNPGDVVSRPLIYIIGSGNITVTANGKTLTLTGVQSGWKIDSDLQWVLSGTTPQQGVYTGEFPTLAPGDNTVQWTGNITRLEIIGRWRYL